MKKLSKLIGFAAAPVLCLSLAGPAAAAGSHVEGYAYDSQSTHVKDGYGGCVKTGTWSEKTPLPAECGGTMAAAPEAAPVGRAVVTKRTIAAQVLFDFNKYNLKPAGKSKLDDLAREIKGTAGVESITVVGHTDSVGSDAYNERLSLRRANTVEKYLEGKGLGNVRGEGMGEREPVASNDTAEGRAKNRRVEIEVVTK